MIFGGVFYRLSLQVVFIAAAVTLYPRGSMSDFLPRFPTTTSVGFTNTKVTKPRAAAAAAARPRSVFG